MNVHLLISKVIMARITDEKKLERLKQTTMKYVVEKGYGGASAVLIAKEAKVAVGYFYLHYKGKYEMVNKLLHNVYQDVINKLDELIENGSAFGEIIKSLVHYLMVLANEEPIKLKFLYVLTNDYSFKIDDEVRSTVYSIIERIKAIGLGEQELDPNLLAEDLYLVLVINPIQFINQRFKNSSEPVELTPGDEDHLLYFIRKILK